MGPTSADGVEHNAKPGLTDTQQIYLINGWPASCVPAFKVTTILVPFVMFNKKNKKYPQTLSLV